MIRFPQYPESATLPPPGTQESPFLEFKPALQLSDTGANGQKEPDYSAAAKQVASFANSYGGTVFVGAKEEKAGKLATGVLKDYPGLSEADAIKAASAYEEAHKNYCRPPPIVHVARHVWQERIVLAVNVAAMPGQLVGVRAGTGDGATWSFPVRISTRTHFISPEQFAMFLDPKTRRIAALLSSIPKGKIVRLAVGTGLPGGKEEVDVHFDHVDEAKNVVVFEKHNESLVEPLDRIITVFLETHPNSEVLHVSVDYYPRKWT